MSNLVPMQEQSQMRVAALIMILFVGEEVLGEDFIMKIKQLDLPALYYHDNKERIIILQCMEFIIECLYECDSLLFGEI